MHIGLVTACYEPVVNGVTRMITLYKSHLEAAGHRVSVFTLGRRSHGAEARGIYRSPAIPLGSSGYYFTTGYTKQARRILAEVDVIHCHHLLMGLEFAKRYGRGPIVYTNHTRYDLYTGAYTGLPQNVADGLLMRIWPYMTDFCHTIISPSKSLKRILREFGVRKPIVVIHNGIEIDCYRRKPQIDVRQLYNIPVGATLFVNVSRLSPEKRPLTLLREFAEIAKISPSYHLLLVGSGASSRQLKRLVGELGLINQVSFAGAITPEYIPDYLTAADVFVTASVSEVHPLAVIEAMAAGLPVVGISSPGLKDTVEHESSGLLSSNDAGALALAMTQLGQSRDKRLAIGATAQKMSQRFDIRITVERTLDVYQKLLATSAFAPYRHSQEYRSGTRDYPGAGS